MKNFNDFTKKKIGGAELYLPSDFVMSNKRNSTKYQIPFGIDPDSIEDLEVYPHAFLNGFTRPIYAKRVSGADPTKARTEDEFWFDRYYLSYGIGERTGELAIYVPFKPLQNFQIRYLGDSWRANWLNSTFCETIDYVLSLLDSDIIYKKKGIWINQHLPIADNDMPLGFRTAKTSEKTSDGPNILFRTDIENDNFRCLIEKYDPENNSRIINTRYAVLMVLAVIAGREYQIFTEKIYGPAVYDSLEGTFIESFILNVCRDSFSLANGSKNSCSGNCSYRIREGGRLTSILGCSLFPLDNIPILSYDDIENRFFYNNYHRGLYYCPYLKPVKPSSRKKSTIIFYDI